MALSRTQLAKAGFADLSEALMQLESVCELTGSNAELILSSIHNSADPDRAIAWLLRLSQSAASMKSVKKLLSEQESTTRLLSILGGSKGLAEFIERHPHTLAFFQDEPGLPGDQEKMRASLLKSVGAVKGFAQTGGDTARDALRIHYRELLLKIAIWDLGHDNPLHQIEWVTGSLSDIAGGALEAGLAIARTEVAENFSPEEVALVDLAIIGMGKCGARELNYLSDVDVIYVGASLDEEKLPTDKALTIATRLAQHTARAIFEVSKEPGLWEVDANLRPEGKDGALVRTLESHLAYYDRWAKDWEFQALLKARPLAGSAELGERYVSSVAPKIWSSASRSNFVEQVQRMRERVTENIPGDDVEFQIKLGPGGLRDIEFTVQLLQLVHGLVDDTVHTKGTLESLARLSEAGYVGRDEAQSFAENYRFLRLLEHRMQLRDLSRTHLMPRDEAGQRVLARATGLWNTADEVVSHWQQTKLDVRELHERLFYRPLLAAVAKLPEETHQLTSDQAEARLAAIGFRDPQGSLKHIAALTNGVSRRAAIQRALLPVMLQWLSEGANPDHGLLTFRLLSEQLGESHWFLRMLRDSAGAAQRLTKVLSGSRYVSDLMELIPESAAWFDGDEELAPTPQDVLEAEVLAILARHHGDDDTARKAVRSMRRREVLRLAIGGILNVLTIDQISQGLSDVTTASLNGYLGIALREAERNPEFAVIAMGRYGGQELGFDSDADVIYVYRPTAECEGEQAQKRAERIVLRIKELVEDPRLPFEIDTDLRPEGKNGAIARSLESYAAYYARWSLMWEAQALLRARAVLGPEKLQEDMMKLIDSVRYPDGISVDDVREIRRIKARVEAERLPQGADPSRHVKLGRGSLSDVEWTVQLLQLQFAHSHPALKTTSSVGALRAAVDAGLIEEVDAQKLIEAWIFSSRVRSGITIWADKATDVLPQDTRDLEGIARLLNYPPGSATRLEEDYLSITRRCRQVVERVFFDF
ncbi:glutamate-ammonia-ligase adenylyltransferase [Aurantimicrobium minutum]|uniref:bifunctional [glutamine synthetase] adenylyltransferase/[glutamine synthetase]-adenylyl-L-tyrosine phosphorylase n=1 Tax=Aurantimicrobium minutum TaxID=708131 RepID=UPI002473B345|nr:bifunctional [glutamine synthetase] adenylyltransferase/[glutamine synthetase]-adenylyl-L-tyrosine phosphorylase [Aurantimicrobium minutum]MDH6278265.1 glutamate-ammonia-ligase adenylyltransferase [Aurantimicrobium minutum]